ncbi:MAG TPA: hypothetical protein VME86_13565 [Acidobacteriaceae bacterium]|nr:hypothetical protein [Acidobacteriaceae bacterium]
MDQSQLHALQGMMAIMPIILIVGFIIAIIPYWMIWKKAGFSPWFSLLIFIPIVNIIAIYALAFSEWKVVPVSQSVTNFTYQNPPSSPQF